MSLLLPKNQAFEGGPLLGKTGNLPLSQRQQGDYSRAQPLLLLQQKTTVKSRQNLSGTFWVCSENRYSTSGVAGIPAKTGGTRQTTHTTASRTQGSGAEWIT